MAAYLPAMELLPRIERGEVAAIGRLISRAEAGVEEARPALAEIYRRAGGAHVVGVTGVPGSGKSTLVGGLVRLLRSQGARVGIIAVDPSSPYSGGAILGDRVRMSELAGDPGIFIRSMATRGATGGMARAALDAVDVLDVGGFDTVVVETVGVGQDEVEIVKASDTTVVVSAPGLGDEIQAIKAGVLEIADIHVVSKADRSDAARTIADLKSMLTLGLHDAGATAWRPPVVPTSAVTGEGLEHLVSEIARHREHAGGGAQGRERKRRIAEFRLEKTAENLLMEALAAADPTIRRSLADEIADRTGDPYSAARRLVATLLQEGRGS